MNLSSILSKKGVIPYFPKGFLRGMRDLLSLIQAGDATPGRCMTIPMMNILIERPFWTQLSGVVG